MGFSHWLSDCRAWLRSPPVQSGPGRHRRRRHRSAPAVLPELLESRTLLAAVHWIGSGRGDWHDPANWQDQSTGAQRVPGSADDATIDFGSVDLVVSVNANAIVGSLHAYRPIAVNSGVLRMNAASHLAGGVALQAGAGLDVRQHSTLAGPSHWSGGSIIANAGLTLVDSGSLTTAGSETKWLYGSLNNAGTFRHAGGELRFASGGPGSTFHNLSGGRFEADGDSRVDGGGKFNNSGLLRKTGTGESEITVRLNASPGSTTEATESRLRLTGGGRLTGGDFNAFGSGVVEFGGGSFNLPGGTDPIRGRGDGRVELSGGQILSRVAPSELDFAPNLFHWTGGTLGGTGCLGGECASELINSGEMTISGDQPKNLSAGVFNEGRIVHAGTGALSGDAFGTDFTNRAGGTWDAQTDGGLTKIDFTNAGLFRRSAGSGEYLFDASSDFRFDGGTVEVTAGEVRMAGALWLNGNTHFVVSAGSQVELSPPAAAFGTGALHGDGTLSGSGLGRVELTSGTAVGVMRLDFPSGMFHWLGHPTLYAGGTIINDGSLTLDGEIPVLSRAHLINHGTITQLGDTQFTMLQTVFVVNHGTWEIRGDGDLEIVDYNNLGSTFFNLGTLTKTAGHGTSRWFADFPASSILSNPGVVDVRSGTLELDLRTRQFDVRQNDVALSGGTWRVGPSSTLRFLGSDGSTPPISTNLADVTLEGTDSAFPNFDALTANGGTVTLHGGRDFATTGPLTNGVAHTRVEASGILVQNRERLVALAVDPETEVLYSVRAGQPIRRFTPDNIEILPQLPRPGGLHDGYSDLDVSSVPLNLGGTETPAGSLLYISGQESPPTVWALNRDTGAVLARVTLPAIPQNTAGLSVHPGRGTLFILNAQTGVVHEVRPADGATLASFPVRPAGSPSFSVGWGDVDVEPLSGNLYITGSAQERIRELTPDGVWVRDVDLSRSGIGNYSSQLNASALAINDTTGEIWLQSELTTTGRIRPFADVTSGSMVIGPGSTLTVNGDYTDASDGTTSIQLAGPPASGAYGRLQVNGIADGPGRVHIDRVDGYGPQIGDVWTVMTWSGRTGSDPVFSGVEPFFDVRVESTQLVIDTVRTASDLSVPAESITAPASARPGEPITVHFDVVNLSTAEAPAGRIDSVFLSRDRVFSPDDLLIGTVSHAVPLPGGDRQTATVQGTLPAVIEGPRHLIAVADSSRRLADADRNNNEAVSTGTITSTIPVISDGDVVTEAIGTGQSLYYRVSPPPGGNRLRLDYQADASGGDVEIFAAAGRLPSRSSFDLRSPERDRPFASLALPVSPDAPLYVLVHLRRLSTPGDGTLTVSRPVPTLSGVSQDRIGNDGASTLEVFGTGLATVGTWELLRGSVVLDATRQDSSRDGTTAWVTFNPEEAPSGRYDLRATPAGGGDAVVLTDAVEVTAAEPGQLEVRLLTPGTFRSTRALVSEVVYRNSGNVDLPAPLLVVTTDNGLLARDRGDAFESDTLVLLATSGTGPAGVLRPGETHRIAFRARPDSVAPLNLQLDEQPAHSTAAVDWDAVESRLRPAGMTDDEWDPYWDPFIAAAGDTWGGYVTLLGRYADAVRRSGSDPSNAYEVFQFARGDLFAQTYGNVRATVRYQGQPISGARVLLQNVDPHGESVTARSGPDGVARLVDVPDGTWDIRVDGWNLPATRVTVTASADLELPVTRGGAVAGTVQRATDGVALAGVRVLLRDETGQLASTQTAADGRFRVSGLPEGNWQLRVAVPGLATQFVDDLFVTEGTEISGLAVTPAAAAIVTGSVHQGSVAVVGADVVLENADGHQFVARTDAFGRYRIPDLAAGTWTVQATAPGLSTASADVTTASGSTSTVPSLRLTPTLAWQVRVSDSADVPVANAEVELSRESDNAIFTGLTDSAGVTTLAGLTAGAWTLRIAADGFAGVEQTVNLTENSSASVQLNAAGELSGRITDDEGRPVSAISVRLLGELGAFELRAVTDADGNYHFLSLPVGTHRLTVGNNDGILIRDVEIIGGVPATQDVVIPGIVISGTVRDADGNAVPGSTVFLARAGHTVATAQTDEAGAWLFRSLIEGDFTLSARHASGLTAEQPLTAGSADIGAVDLQFGTQTYLVNVATAGGAPRGNALVTLTPSADAAGDRSVVVTTDASGQALFVGLASGEYLVQAAAPGVAAVQTIVTVSAGGVTNLTLLTGIRITGNVTAGGDPLAGAEIQVRSPLDGSLIAVGRSDSGGAFRTERLLPGTVDLIISHPARQTVMLRDQVASEGFTVDVELPEPSAEVEGTVVDSEGAPVGRVLVAVTDARGARIAATVTSGDGAYRLATLPAGQYAIGFGLLGYLPAGRALTVPSGGVTTVDAVLTIAATDDLRLSGGGQRRLARSIGDWARERNPEPQRDPFDFDTLPPVPDPDCPEKFEAWLAVLRARDHKNSSWDAWEAAHANFQTTLRTAVPQFILQLANTIGSVYSLFLPSGAVSRAIQGANTLGRGTVATLTGVNVALGVKAAYDNFAAAVNGGGSAINNLFNLESGLTSVLNNSSAARDLITELGSELGEGTGGGVTALGTLDAVNNLITLTRDTIAIIGDIRNLGESVPTARDNYLAAIANELARREALGRMTCRPDEPDPPPETEPRILRVRRRLTQGNSSDPNDKLTVGFAEQGFVRRGETLTFVVRFENQPSASLPAQQVFISDFLSDQLDWATLELVAIGFNNVEYAVPDGLREFQGRITVPTDDFPVDTRVSFNPHTGELKWAMESVDPLYDGLPEDPEAGFLPPNDATGRGQGFVIFRAQAAAEAGDGTRITNRASIVFDDNDPIITNSTLNTIDDAAPASQVGALPAASPPVFTVDWSADDGTGAGVASWDIRVSENGGAWQTWIAGTTETSAEFTGSVGSTYAFYSIARDHVGLQELPPGAADAETTVVSGGPEPPALLSPDPLTQNLTPHFTWSSVANAASSELWVSNLSTGENPFYRATVAATAHQPSEPFGIGRYRVWIRSLDAAANAGDWSAPFTFRINTPVTIPSLERFQSAPRPVLHWDPLPGAVRYDLWVDNLSTGESQFVREPQLTQTTWAAPSDWPLGRYRVWVQAFDGGGIHNRWSAFEDIVIATPPIPDAPRHATFDRRPVFRWTAPPGATSHEFMLRSRNTGETVVHATGLSSPEWRPISDLPDGPWRWWAIGISDAGVRSFWTDPVDIHIGGRPELIAAMSAPGDGRVTIQWTPVDGAVRYDLWVDRIGGPPQVIREPELTDASFTSTQPLPPGTYRAWVRAISAEGERSVWSLSLAFTVAASDIEDGPADELRIRHLLPAESPLRFPNPQAPAPVGAWAAIPAAAAARGAADARSSRHSVFAEDPPIVPEDSPAPPVNACRMPADFVRQSPRATSDVVSSAVVTRAAAYDAAFAWFAERGVEPI